jgi:phage terminase large subunit-like protein
MTLQAFCSTTRSFMTVDTSYTASADSDFKVACLMAVTHNNELFVLDLWSKQCQQTKLVEQALRMADRWRWRSVWPETVKEGLSVYNDLYSIVATRAKDMAGVVHLPGIRKLNPGRTEKVAKIAALQLRFEHGKIKLPLSRRNEGPWRRLFEQVEQFNPNAPDGGLQHDDELDCVAMSQYVLRGRLGRIEVDEPEPPTILDRLKAGEVYDEGGIPLGLAVDWNRVPPEDLVEILRARDHGAVGSGTKV